MTVRSLSGVPDSQVKSYANEAETTKYHLLGQSGDSQAETAGLPEDTPDLSSKLIESHLQLLDSPRAFVPIFASFVHLKVAHGDRTPSCPKDESNSSIFFGARKASISIKEYVKRIALHSKCSPICFIGAYVYLQRLSQVSKEYKLCSQSIHRLLITSVLIAAKLLDDKFYSNSFYARIGGVSIKELNLLELEMLKALDFRAYISHEELSKVLSLLVSNETSDKEEATARRSKKRGNEGAQPEIEVGSLPAKLHHDSKSDQVLVTAGESVCEDQPSGRKATTAVVKLSCLLQESSTSSLDGKSLPVQCAISVGGT